MPDDQRNEPNSTARGGPRAGDPVHEQLARDRNNLGRQADLQATPETEDQHRAVAERTGTARRAEEAAGNAPDEDNRPDAQRAYQESRGDRRGRDGRTG